MSEVPGPNPDEMMMQGAADAAREIVENDRPAKTGAEIAEQVERITDKLDERARNVDREHRQDGPHYGSDGLRVTHDGLEAGKLASSFSRISKTPRSTTVENFTYTGRSGGSSVIGDRAVAYRGRESAAPFVTGNVEKLTPGGSNSGPATREENLATLAKGLSTTRSEVAKAENRQKSAEDKAA